MSPIACANALPLGPPLAILHITSRVRLVLLAARQVLLSLLQAEAVVSPIACANALPLGPPLAILHITSRVRLVLLATRQVLLSLLQAEAVVSLIACAKALPLWTSACHPARTVTRRQSLCRTDQKTLRLPVLWATQCCQAIEQQ